MQRFRSLVPDANPLPDPIRVFPVLSQLQDQCQSLGVAPSTRRIYQSGLKSFTNFVRNIKFIPYQHQA